jgi:uncharacterized protein (TIGR00369 family)
MEKIASPYENFLQMSIVEKREGFCKIKLCYRKELTNPHGNFHGGVIASIIDTATVQSLRTVMAQGPFLTVQLEIRYKSPSDSSELFAQAYPTHLKGKFFVTQVEVVDKDNHLIAEGKVKSFLPAWNSKQSK